MRLYLKMKSYTETSRIILLSILIAGFCGFLRSGAAAESACCRAVEASGVKEIQDDLGWAELSNSVGYSLDYLRRQPESRVYRLCEREYSAGELLMVMTDFMDLVGRRLESGEFEKLFYERFELCGASGSEGEGSVLVTAYFEPLLEGSLKKNPPFIYPLYGKPQDLVKREGRVGRLEGDRLVPYWSRAEIENEGLLAGKELVFLDDPVEAFILHIQGSGRVRLRDGRIRPIRFAAKNGLPYRSIGKLLVDQGKMELASVSLPAIVDYLESHPSERKSILQYNQSFIFFRWGDAETKGPLGSLGVPLTAGRSVALDRDCFPPGAIAYLESEKPVFGVESDIIGWSPLRRFVVNQDSGSAIMGSGRIDLFLGAGEKARKTAGLMKHQGKLYFLIGKK
jgi:membrane-bound lytic murein transglycosylase A